MHPPSVGDVRVCLMRRAIMPPPCRFQRCCLKLSENHLSKIVALSAAAVVVELGWDLRDSTRVLELGSVSI